MTSNALLQCALFMVVVTALGFPLGHYIARVYEGEASFAQRIFGPFERRLYRVCGVHPDEDMSVGRYTGALLVFSSFSIVAVYALMRLQHVLPLNPAELGAVGPEVSFNTATSFATNTNWQAYGGESTLSYFTQMLGLTVQNFVSAAAGIAVMVALIRGFTRRTENGIGNFWVDMSKSVLYVLLPLSFVFALLLVSQGVCRRSAPT